MNSPTDQTTSEPNPPGQLTLGDLIAVMERHYPAAGAESWDQVGLVCGDPAAPVRRVLLTVDVTAEVVADAISDRVDAIIAHHPLLLRGIHSVDARDPKGQMLIQLISHRVACFAAHTNADIVPDGVCTAMAEAIGLAGSAPLDPRPDRLDQLVTFVPSEHTQGVVDALAEAGAGAIGEYDRCYFAHQGTGSFRPSAQANPFIGASGTVSEVTEERLEMVLPRHRRRAVVEALHRAHPYETPAYHLIEIAPVPGEGPRDSGLGRIGELAEPMTAAAFAQQVADALPETASGVRLGGDPNRLVKRIAILAGAGDSHLDAARKAGADAYLTSDLRHHPATEALEHPDAPVLLDVAHWAAEWTWLPVLRRTLAAALPDLEIEVSTRRTDAWAETFHKR